MKIWFIFALILSLSDFIRSLIELLIVIYLLAKLSKSENVVFNTIIRITLFKFSYAFIQLLTLFQRFLYYIELVKNYNIVVYN